MACWRRNPNVRCCAAVGEALGKLHRAGVGFALYRPNALGLEAWPARSMRRARADEVRPGLAAEIAGELAYLAGSWPRDLPKGVIHADLFPDNVLFVGDELSGLIDFYFACTDELSYDVAICLNAWCFEPDGSFNIAKGLAFFNAYESVRKLTGAEVGAFVVLARGAALRFALTRLVDWLNVPAHALVHPKDPLEYVGKLRFHQQTGSARRTRFAAMNGEVSIWTDGACSGNPGPGGWGAILNFGAYEKELFGGEGSTTNNRMELTAAIEALAALNRACTVHLHTDSNYLKGGITTWMVAWKRNGWRTADKKPVKNVELWQRLEAAAAPHTIDWRWVKSRLPGTS